MTDELVSKSQMKRIAIQKGDALPPRRICEHGSQEIKCLICENSALEDEIERLRAEVATVRTDAHDALCDERAARERAESELAALRKRVDESVVAIIRDQPGARGYVRAYLSRNLTCEPPIDERVRLVPEG